MKLLLAAAWFLSAMCAQEPAGVIEGSVRDAVNQAPVAGVELSLNGPIDGTAVTDAAGGFRFEKLLTGIYGMRLKKAGYLDIEFGRPPERIHLNAANAREALTIDLTPLSHVEGRILDEEGQPLAGVLVYGGLLGPAKLLATSDVEGRYRMENVAPGDYRLALCVPLEVRRKTLKRDPESGETFGYAGTQFYSGVDDIRMATPVQIPAGAHLQGFEIRLRRSRLVAFSGRIIETAGRAAIDTAEVELSMSGNSGFPDEIAKRQRVESKGAFRFELIQPGRYWLAAYRGGAEEDLPFLTPVDVGKAGIEDMPVAVPPFIQVRGVLKVPDPKMGWQGSLNVTLNGAIRKIRSKPVPVSADGTFTVDKVPPGQWQIVLDARNLRESVAPNRTLHVAAVRLGEQDALWGQVMIAESGNPPVEVTLSGDVGRLAGTVSDGSQPGKGILIVLRRADGQNNPSQFLSPEMSRPDGSYLVSDVIPGNYEVSAWQPSPTGTTAVGPANRCGDRLGKVTIKAGETAVLPLQVCK